VIIIPSEKFPLSATDFYQILERLPVATGIDLPPILVSGFGLLAIAAIVTFFVTSSDSGSLVIDIITAGGKSRPPVAQRIYWAGLEGLVAAVLLVGGGLTALQTAAISAGFPFAILSVVMIYCLHRALVADRVSS
jgi:choline/glycine/proline betaine transport protein